MAVAAALFLILLVTPAAYAVQFIVGDASGWTEFVDYTNWVQGKTFKLGDTLVFNYGTNHRVDEVTESDYRSCSSGNAIDSHSDGSTVITLSKAGPMYFVCPVSGHCASGMKLGITVAAGSGGTSPTTTSPRSGSTTPSRTPSSPNGAPTIINSGLMMMLGFSVVSGAVLAIMS